MKINVLLIFALIICISLSSAYTDDEIKQKTKDSLEEFTSSFMGPLSHFVTYATNPDTCSVSQDHTLWLFIPSIIAAFLIILISALVYMTGTVLNSEQILNFAKEEFYQSGISIFLAFIVLSFVLGSHVAAISLNLFGMEAVSFIDAAMLVSIFITNKIATSLGSMMFFNGILTFFATSSLSIGSFHSSIHFSPGLALKPLTDVVTLIVQFLAVSLSEWMFHVFSLCLIKKWAISVFLPFGILLRAIPQTRDGGSALIALMLVLYIIYPITFLGMGAIFSAMHGDFDTTGIIVGLLSKFGAGSSIVLITLLLVSKSLLIPLLIVAMIDAVFIFLKEAIFLFFIMSLMLPFFSIMITLTAVKEISKTFFGVDINLSSLIRVI
ncbi:MAG: hypothetical protein PHU63_01500 [Candidatus ainarchaeum sp.]|nr:hypothetical protein [Candidatus ainarchaeum sp.]